MMFKFIHTADIHLDSPLRGLEAHEGAPVDEIRGATRRAFDNLIDTAVEEEVDFVLIAGDLYDGDWKDYNTGLYFVSRMGRLDQAGIKVFLISGNHDAVSQITRTMPLPDNLIHLSSKKPQSVALDDLGVIVHGQSYGTKAVTENLAAGYPMAAHGYFNIGLLHTSLSGREDHENYAPCSLDDLKSKGYDYWALGHVHKREVVADDPWIIFPGSIQGRHIREAGPKGASLVTVDDNQVIDVQIRELDVLRWTTCLVDMSECETTDSVYRAIRSNLERERDNSGGRTLVIRLVLAGQSPAHAQLFEKTEQWAEEFRAIAASLGDVWLEQVKFRTSRKIDFDEILGEDTPLAGLIESIREVQLSSAKVSELVPELIVLKSKLPSEIYDDNEPFLELAPENQEKLRTEIQEMLIARLLTLGEER